MQTVQEIVRSAENRYTNGTPVKSGKYVEESMYENIETIYAYLNSKHISGDTDALGREKPFFNIVTAAVNIWYRATDIDRKNIRIKADNNSQVLPSFVATVLLQDWMKKSRFGKFLNKWGRVLAQYGSAVIEFVEKDGKLHANVIPWNKIICDPIDFESNPQIKKLQLTPAQLRKNKSYDQELVEKLIDAVASRELLDGQKVDSYNDFIPVYEVHGEMELSLLTDNEKDDDKYRQQMQVVSFVENSKNEYDDFTLYRGREKKSPFMLTHLIEEDNKTLSMGAVQYLFDAQWMKNHTVKQTKDHLDLASKLIYQTSDGSFVGNNVLDQIETGDILVHELNAPLTQVNNHSHDITSLANFGKEFEVMGKEITSTPDAQRGNTMPSGTAYRQVAILEETSGSLFELMTENKGLAIEDMMRVYILPYIIKLMNTSDEVAAVLEENDINYIDAIYVPGEAIKRANNQTIETVLAGDTAEQPDMQAIEGEVKNELSINGNQRFFKPSEVVNKKWNEVLEDFGDTVTVEVVNENIDKEQMFTTLNTTLQTIANNPMVLQDPNGRMLFSKILTETGRVSPLQLSQQVSQPQVGGGGGELDKLAEVEKDKNTI